MDHTPRPAWEDASRLDVAVLRWPEQDACREALESRGQARLLLVRPDADPPETWTALEDWVRRPGDALDVCARRATLLGRMQRNRPLVLDEDGAILRRGTAWVALPPAELAVLRPLLARTGEVVGRDVLQQAAAAAGEHEGEYTSAMLDATVHRLRGRMKVLHIRFHTLRGAGYLIEVDDWPSE